MSDSTTISQKRKLSESSEVLNSSNKKAATDDDCLDDTDCQILDVSIPLIVLDSDVDECGASQVVEIASTTDVDESDGMDEWVWVEKVVDFPPEASAGTSETKVEHNDVTIESHDKDESTNEPLIRISFRDKTSFNELKNMIHQTIRETLFNHKRIVQIYENPDDQQLHIFDANEDDSCVFMVDANPTIQSADTSKKTSEKTNVPQYSLNVSKVFDHSTPTVPPPKEDECDRARPPKNTCFNCNGNHTIRDCPEPKNHQMIQKNRNKFVPFKNERYHVDVNQQFGHFQPGVLSQSLRHALGLRDQELPLYVYRMRMLGYPPGWLEEAKVTQSGVELFDDRVRIIWFDA